MAFSNTVWNTYLPTYSSKLYCKTQMLTIATFYYFLSGFLNCRLTLKCGPHVVFENAIILYLNMDGSNSMLWLQSPILWNSKPQNNYLNILYSAHITKKIFFIQRECNPVFWFLKLKSYKFKMHIPNIAIK